MIFRHEVLYFNVAVLCRKNDYRISFMNFVIISSLPVVLYGCESWSPTVREERGLRVFEISPKRDEVTGEWGKLHNEKLNDVYSSPNIVRMIKSRRMRLSRHVVRMGRREAYTGIWWGNMKDTVHLGDPDIDWSVILRSVFRTLVWSFGLDRAGSG